MILLILLTLLIESIELIDSVECYEPSLERLDNRVGSKQPSLSSVL